jgi:hypothetical protein
MPKATLTFKLPEEDGEFLLAKNGGKYFSALCEIRTEMRNHWKYGKKIKECWEAIEAVINDINWDEIV